MSYHLTHPDSDQEIEVDADSVPTYLSQGWQTKPGAREPAIPTTADPAKDKE